MESGHQHLFKSTNHVTNHEVQRKHSSLVWILRQDQRLCHRSPVVCLASYHRSPRGKKFNIVDGSAPLPCFSYLDPDIWRKYSFALRKHRHFPVVLGYVYLSWDPLPQCGWKCHIMHTHWNPGNPHLCWVFPYDSVRDCRFPPKKKRLSSSHRSQQLARFERKSGQT